MVKYYTAIVLVLGLNEAYDFIDGRSSTEEVD
jgi:hypothetical protein